MAIDRKTEFRKTERQAQVTDLYLRGKTMREIGAALGVSRQTICNDIAELHERWLEKADSAIKQRAAVELARIDHLEQVAWGAWERSCQAAVTRKTRKTKGRVNKDGDQLPDLDVAERAEEERDGNPRFLERVAWCIQKRCEMLGILQPEAGGVMTVTTVVNRVDMNVVLGKEKGIPIDRIGSVQPN